MKKLVKKLFCTFAAILLAAPPGMPCVYAEGTTKLKITSSQFMEIKGTNINYYTDSDKTNKVGDIQVKLNKSDNSPLTPSESEGGAMYDFGEASTIGEVVVELRPINDYMAPSLDQCIFTVDQSTDEDQSTQDNIRIEGTNIILNLTSSKTNTLDFAFVKNNGGSPPPPVPDGGDGENDPGPMVKYPIMAQFDVPGGSPIQVSQSEEGYIVIPENWTSGKVNFKAKIFTRSDNGTVEPFNEQAEDSGTASDIDVEIEGIANGEEIHETVTGSADRKSITIQEGFSEYGKLQLHIENEAGSAAKVTQILNVVHRSLINVKADALLGLSESFGTVSLNQAIITKDEVKDVKIFFGNTKTTLIVSGSTVKGITAVTGGSSIVLNGDGSATVSLPKLSSETTTPVEITIEKLDGSYIKRKVNIVRTAIQLGHFYDRGKHAVFAGYVVNKGYLYNNQPHNDAIFNAYLQVILYKDNAVAGYKQIKIDDETLVNDLKNDNSGSLELYSDKQIAIYGEEAGNFIDGVNKVSVFLTNGPIDFNGDTLPSVEFGVGSGVTCEWEELL